LINSETEAEEGDSEAVKRNEEEFLVSGNDDASGLVDAGGEPLRSSADEVQLIVNGI